MKTPQNKIEIVCLIQDLYKAIEGHEITAFSISDTGSVTLTTHTLKPNLLLDLCKFPRPVVALANTGRGLTEIRLIIQLVGYDTENGVSCDVNRVAMGEAKAFCSELFYNHKT